MTILVLDVWGYYGDLSWADSCSDRAPHNCEYIYIYLLELVRLVEVGDLPAAQDVVDVLQEALLNHLCVVEDEHWCFVVNSSLPVQSLQIYRDDNNKKALLVLIICNQLKNSI